MVDWGAQRAKLKTANWLVKLLIVVVIGGFGLMWAADKAVTVGDFVTVVAKTPIWLVIAIELFDKLADKKDYTTWGVYMSRQWGGNSVLWGIAIGMIAFLGVLYIMAGTISMNMNAYSPGIFLATLAYALYIVMPETGDDELILFLWLAAQVATKGQYLNEAVFSLPFITKIFSVVISRIPLPL
uniref:Uncharacterized protein n=1 Tax=Thermococcus aciditolerans TaxID=2598455 RepID=A0A5C0SN79_9EURY|nr:hypothetical protein FPV09_04995 [Thermococcus aciditolerans]